MNSKTEEPLHRTFLFGVDTLNFLLKLPNTKIYSIIIFQQVKASGSSGANYEEPHAAELKKDF